jgi:transcription-repair coupling factor (superfamily II helicase)
LSRYGSEDTHVELDRLGGTGWQTRKARMKNRIREIAHELIKIAAERQLREAPRLAVRVTARPTSSAAGFPYEETDDQQAAIDAHSRRPRQRPPDGPVDLRRRRLRQDRGGAARRVQHGDGGKQVAGGGADDAACAPTAPRRSPSASRFPGARRQASGGFGRRAQAASRLAIADGQIEFVVAPHALLGKAIKFKDLGLVIVDEGSIRRGAQGAAEGARAEVHVLTLTATPIPRTLQLALTGVRDLSIIASPPVDRLAVRTFVSPFDPLIVREALLRERYRGGQSFYVCPRIEDLAGAKDFLDKNVPGGEGRGRARPDAVAGARRHHVGVLRRQVRRAAVDHHHRVRPRHPDRRTR